MDLFLLFMLCVCRVFLSVHCSLVVTFWEMTEFCHFPMWCPGSNVVLNCIDS